MGWLFSMGLLWLSVYLLFWRWYGGRPRPLGASEIERFIADLRACMPLEAQAEMVEQVHRVSHGDDGKAFVMHNLVRYRPQARYPAGHPLQSETSARRADQRYARAIIWPLLRHGSLPIFIARRSGGFVEPEGADPWHYVAMVRYRSRRDFLRFALHIERAGLTVHKWAAIEKTHIFPMQPLFSLFMLRSLVAGLWLALAVTAWALVRLLTPLLSAP
ncbi:hypothetical protein [Hydrogenophaga sp.]|jgi:hypothetical protein|uniref:hypothetical protein n=1 Tax=Hydrogenophaga sp. TaxID=1904254 RepID=UPI003F6C9758